MTGLQSVEVLEEIALPRNAPRRKGWSAKTRLPRLRHRANGGILIGVTVCHGLLCWLALTYATGSPIRDVDESLVAIFIRPRVIRTADPVRAIALPTTVSVPAEAPRSDLPIPEIDRPTTLMAGVGLMVPHPDADGSDASLFAQRAGLGEGQGATVVLRVEVFGSGEIGRVEVDVSGGSEQIDEEAVAYVRSIPWTGGMIDGRPSTMWIRWGVRLQA